MRYGELIGNNPERTRQKPRITAIKISIPMMSFHRKNNTDLPIFIGENHCFYKFSEGEMCIEKDYNQFGGM